MLDRTLFVAQNQRPTIGVPGAAWQVAFLPDSLTPNFLDLRLAYDMARANPIFGNFLITTTFQNVAANFLRFAVFVSNTPDFLQVFTNPESIVARSSDINSPVLLAGQMFSVALPAANTLLRVLEEGRRFITLGMEVLVPTADWNAGGVDAFFAKHALPTRPMTYAAGF